MSQKDQIYSNYLARWHKRHPNMIEPETFGTIGGAPLSNGPDISGLESFSHDCKYNTWGRPLGNFELSDGRIVELFTSTSGALNMCAVFPSKAAFYAYSQPMSRNVYFEEW